MNDIKVLNGVGFTASMARGLRAMMPHGVALLCAVATAGCLTQGADGDEDAVDSVQEGVETSNALTNNALTNNALTNNALTNNALTNNALTNNSLNTGAINASLSDPNARAVLKYIVSCALPRTGQVDFTVDAVSYTYEGELGLAPQWANTGVCNTACQELVSACVMSRVDYLGEKVLISLRGKTPALDASGSEQAAYNVAEGAYYGNIFLATPARFACIGPGRTGLPRVCGPTTSGCVVTSVGLCEDVCDKQDKKNGFFTNCRNQAKDASNHWPSGTTTYSTSTTVFLSGT